MKISSELLKKQKTFPLHGKPGEKEASPKAYLKNLSETPWSVREESVSNSKWKPNNSNSLKLPACHGKRKTAALRSCTSPYTQVRVLVVILFFFF